MALALALALRLHQEERLVFKPQMMCIASLLVNIWLTEPNLNRRPIW